MQKNTQAVFERFLSSLPKTTDIYSAAIPIGLTIQQTINIQSWVPDEEFLGKIRNWMDDQGEDVICYFLMEGIEGECTSFILEKMELEEEILENLNPGYRSVLTNFDFSWVISSDSDKIFYTAGLPVLF